MQITKQLKEFVEATIGERLDCAVERLIYDTDRINELPIDHTRADFDLELWSSKNERDRACVHECRSVGKFAGFGNVKKCPLRRAMASKEL